MLYLWSNNCYTQKQPHILCLGQEDETILNMSSEYLRVMITANVICAKVRDITIS